MRIRCLPRRSLNWESATGISHALWGRTDGTADLTRAPPVTCAVRDSTCSPPRPIAAPIRAHLNCKCSPDTTLRCVCGWKWYCLMRAMRNLEFQQRQLATEVNQFLADCLQQRGANCMSMMAYLRRRATRNLIDYSGLDSLARFNEIFRLSRLGRSMFCASTWRITVRQRQPTRACSIVPPSRSNKVSGTR
jgi:hypothetical protein